jgi:cell division protein FtsL
MAAGVMNITGMIVPVGAGVGSRQASARAGITPEFYFHKTIDNSRLVKVADPKRRREIRVFAASVAMLFLLMMFYAWQHFRAIEYGYRIEAQKSERERLVELNRTLRLEEASLRDPSRIDALARQMGLESPQPGQVIRLDVDPEGGTVLAQVSSMAVMPAQ